MKSNTPVVVDVRAADVGYFSVKVSLGRHYEPTGVTVSTQIFPSLAPQLLAGMSPRSAMNNEPDGEVVKVDGVKVLNGAVLATCKPRHRHQEFLSFLREIDQAVPAELDIHCIVDNYATRNHPKIKTWLAARPRWHMHFIRTYSSWLNQVERFFLLITDKAIRRSSFTSVTQLVQRIDHFVTAHNANCQPFKWTATADSTLEKLHRLCSRISGTGH